MTQSAALLKSATWAGGLWSGQLMGSPALGCQDLKPPNILLDDYDRCVVADFGISKVRPGRCVRVLHACSGRWAS